IVRGSACREQREPESVLSPPRIEGSPRGVALDSHLVEIVHPCPAESAVGDREAGRLDQMGGDPQAGAEPENRSRILGNIGLVKRDRGGIEVDQKSVLRRTEIRRSAKDLCDFLSELQWHTCTPPVRVPITR